MPSPNTGQSGFGFLQYKEKGKYGVAYNADGSRSFFVVDSTNRATTEDYSGKTPWGEVLNGKLVDQKIAPTTGTQTRGYTNYSEAKDEKSTPGAMLLQQEAEAVAQSRAFGPGGAGTASGMLADNEPLGSAIDDENRYMRRAGAVLLR